MVGVKVVVVVGMEEDMEEKLVEELVVEKREGWPAKEGSTAVVRSLLAVGEERRKKMKERRRKWGVYI